MTIGDLVKYNHTDDPAKFHDEWDDWHGIVTHVKTVEFTANIPQVMCNITWTNGHTGRAVTDYVAAKNLKVISK